MKENFAIKLRELRKASGMTQEQLAAEFGVSVQAVSKWETAASYPDIELMPRIADLFGVSLDELLRDVKNEKNIDAGEKIYTDAEQQCDAACRPESIEVEYEDENDDEDDDYDFDDEENPFYEVTCDSCGQKLNVSEDVLLEGEIECPNCGENLEFDFSELFSNEEDDECDADCASCDGCSDTEE